MLLREQKEFFHVIFPRQKLYDVELFKVFFSTLFGTNKGYSHDVSLLANVIKLTKKEHLALTPYARVGIHLVLKYIISRSKKKEVLLTPFTIRDMENMVISAGGSPKYIDHDVNSTDLSYELIEKYLKNNHRSVGALLLTHFVVINPEIEKIIKLCRKYKIFLVQDCAIVFGASFKNIPIHKFGDASVLSFNMFKFVSSIHGGAVITKDKNLISYIESIQNDWRAFGAQDLLKYFVKGILFKIITSKYIFNSLSFKIILYATKYNIGFLKTLLINDQRLRQKKKLRLPKKYQRQLNVFQVKSILRQIPNLENMTLKRKKNFRFLEKHIKNPRVTKLVNTKRYCDGGFINFPVLVENREVIFKTSF